MDLFDIVFGQPELVATVVSPLCFVDRLSLSFTCRLVRAVVGEHLDMAGKVSATLRDCMTSEQYKHMRDGYAVVSGPLLLRVLYGEELLGVLYLRSKILRTVGGFCSGPEYYSITKILKLERWMLISHIYVLESRQEGTIEKFDHEMYKNSYSGGKLRLANLEEIMKRETGESLAISYKETKRRIREGRDREELTVLYSSGVA